MLGPLRRLTTLPVTLPDTPLSSRGRAAVLASTDAENLASITGAGEKIAAGWIEEASRLIDQDVANRTNRQEQPKS